jgi:hypothetical protein
MTNRQTRFVIILQILILFSNRETNVIVIIYYQSARQIFIFHNKNIILHQFFQ